MTLTMTAPTTPRTSTTSKHAASAVALHPLLAERWSPRAYDAEHTLDEGAVTALLEAARWAPSAGNSQPWRFLFARRGEPAFDGLVAALAQGNQVWARHASALVLATAVGGPDHEGVPYAVYDLGQAVAHLTTQAQALGLVTHQMGGFDGTAVRRTFRLADELLPVVVVAVGVRGDQALLPEQLAERERAPRTRLSLEDLLLPVSA